MRDRQLPGGVFVNETGTKQYPLVGGSLHGSLDPISERILPGVYSGRREELVPGTSQPQEAVDIPSALVVHNGGQWQRRPAGTIGVTGSPPAVRASAAGLGVNISGPRSPTR